MKRLYINSILALLLTLSACFAADANRDRIENPTLTTKTKSKAIEMIAAFIMPNENTDRYTKMQKKENRVVANNTKYTIFLKNSVKENIKVTQNTTNQTVHMDQNLILLNMTFTNNDDKDEIKISRELLKLEFEHIIFYWTSDPKQIAKPGASVHLLAVVSGDERFDVEKKEGSVTLNYSAKRDMEKNKN
jgi:hypothetical protein